MPFPQLPKLPSSEDIGNFFEKGFYVSIALIVIIIIYGVYEEIKNPRDELTNKTIREQIELTLENLDSHRPYENMQILEEQLEDIHRQSR